MHYNETSHLGCTQKIHKTCIIPAIKIFDSFIDLFITWSTIFDQPEKPCNIIVLTGTCLGESLSCDYSPCTYGAYQYYQYQYQNAVQCNNEYSDANAVLERHTCKVSIHMKRILQDMSQSIPEVKANTFLTFLDYSLLYLPIVRQPIHWNNFKIARRDFMFGFLLENMKSLLAIALTLTN